jgi:hypothetical protein
MAVAVQSPVFQALGKEDTFTGPNELVENRSYWWNTSGRDLANMLREANYPEEVQRNFLSYYRDSICTQLGPRPDSNSAKSGVGWDGSPLEYSWELKGSTKKSAVRFVVDLSPLHPADNENPLSMESTQKVVDAMAAKTPGFDDTWVHSLKRWFVYSHLSPEEQKALVKESGQQTSVILGFDIYPTISAPGGLPVMAKTLRATRRPLRASPAGRLWLRVSSNFLRSTHSPTFSSRWLSLTTTWLISQLSGRAV